MEPEQGVPDHSSPGLRSDCKEGARGAGGSHRGAGLWTGSGVGLAGAAAAAPGAPVASLLGLGVGAVAGGVEGVQAVTSRAFTAALGGLWGADRMASRLCSDQREARPHGLEPSGLRLRRGVMGRSL